VDSPPPTINILGQFLNGIVAKLVLVFQAVQQGMKLRWIESGHAVGQAAAPSHRKCQAEDSRLGRYPGLSFRRAIHEEFHFRSKYWFNIPVSSSLSARS
jgi:hypothetical protein